MENQIPSNQVQDNQVQDNNVLINQTKKWLSSVIIDHTLCPFAKQAYDNHGIHFAVIEATDLQGQLEQVIIQCAALDNDANRETSLLIFPVGLSNSENDLADFENYLDFLEIATALLKKQGYEGIYQLASFHPEYCFAGTSPDDASNYTNRSPYPMLHILRESSIEAALEKFPNPENIPDNNIQLTKGLGLKFMQKLLADCYK